MISVKKALQIVTDNVNTLDIAVMDISDVLGHFLAEDVVSDMNMPPFNRSAMDGYALIADDTLGCPVDLEVVETISAGRKPEKILKTGQAARIMTGAIVPDGADSVIMVENTESICNGGKVRVLEQIKKGKNIAIMGEDIRKGQVVLREGTRLRPQEIGVLASVGRKKIKVFRSPCIGIISTGDELVEIDAELEVGKIRNSNSYSLAAQSRQIVKNVEIFDIVPDNKEKICSMIKSGLNKDILILSGGVSIGDYDLVGEALNELGVEVFFKKVALRPGKPTMFGKIKETVIFALPGNPVASFVTFELFVYPAIQKMMGAETYSRPLINVVLEADYPARKKLTEYRPAHIRQKDGKLSVLPVEWHGSADLLSTTNANCLLVVPEDVEKITAGQIVNVMLLGLAMNNEK